MTNANMNIERLQRLAAILRTIPDERFDLTLWRIERTCGTVACAVGWAGQDREFKKEGFAVTSANPLPTYREPETEIRHFGWDAVEKFFGLHPVVAQVVFTHSGYTPHTSPSPLIVADCIEKVLIRWKDRNDAAKPSSYIDSHALYADFLTAMRDFQAKEYPNG